MSTLRVVVDTNIVISGLLFGGVPLKVIKAGLNGRYTWVLSPFLIQEIETVLSSKKFGLTTAEIQSVTQPIFDIAEIIIPHSQIKAIPRCEGDNRVLECAIDGRCDYIVTGDRRDLLSLEKYDRVTITSAKFFVDKII
jgi:putative PIN family toxin of toxin-antitoxin system